MTAYDDAKAAVTAELYTGGRGRITPEIVRDNVFALTDVLQDEIEAFGDAIGFRGNWDASASSFPGSGTAATGSFYRVSVAGTVDSIAFSVGDGIYALVDDASTSTYAANWQKTEGIITAAEIGVALGYTAANAAALNASNLTSGTVAAARGGAGAISGILKANGTGVVSAATSATDYAPATSGSAILKGNGAGGFSSAAAGTDYAAATSGSAILKGNGAGGFSSASSGTDYQAPVTAAVLAALAFGPFTTIASATTTDLSTVATIGVSISGTVTITGFGTGANLLRIGKFAGILTLTHNASSLILPGGTNITTAAGDRFIALSDGSGNWTVVAYTKADGTAVVSASAGVASFNARSGTVVPASGDYSISGNTIALPRGQLAGMTTSNNVGTPNTKIDVSAGTCRDDTDAFNIVFAASKTIDCGTTGANALDTGALANSTWYHLYAIAKADGTMAALASTSVSSPTMPSGYIYKRRIGSAKTDGSAHFITYVQLGDEFLWKSTVKDVDNTGPGTSAVLYTLSVPTGVQVGALFSLFTSNGGTASTLVTSPDQTDVAADTTSLFSVITTASNTAPIAHMQVRTNTSAQIRARSDTASVSAMRIQTKGWEDTRGRFA